MNEFVFKFAIGFGLLFTMWATDGIYSVAIGICGLIVILTI